MDDYIDPDKVRELIKKWRGTTNQTMHRVNLVYEVAADDLESILPAEDSPEEPKVGEAWLVSTRGGGQREALKAGNRWYVKDGDDVEDWVEEALIPIARLVPEVQA